MLYSLLISINYGDSNTTLEQYDLYPISTSSNPISYPTVSPIYFVLALLLLFYTSKYFSIVGQF
jgi:hypothetical protein